MRYKLLILIIPLVASCIKAPKIEYVSELKVPYDFDWKVIENKQVKIETTSSVVNEKGDTIGTLMPPGDYNLIVAKNSTLTIVQTPVAPQTKAIGGAVKQAVYFPAKGKYATMMFEDLFPSKGDMDMNDAVFGINIEYYLDNQARIRAFRINIQPRAIGSSYGLIGLAAAIYTYPGISFVDRITHSSNSYVRDLFNVTYSGDSYSVENGNLFDVIPITGNFRNYFNNTKDLFLNVRNVDPFTTTEEFYVDVELKSSATFPVNRLTFLEPLQANFVNIEIFGIFGGRGKEVHFKNGRATNYFYHPYFVVTNTTNFSTIDNWVWAVLSDQSIRHPQEFKKIYNAYPNFRVWAETGGGSGAGWYTPAVLDSLHTVGDFGYVN